MTADEIREVSKKVSEACDALPESERLATGIALITSLLISMIPEIAAQLAEINENLRRVQTANSGGKPAIRTTAKIAVARKEVTPQC
jgi:hypothetical protein